MVRHNTVHSSGFSLLGSCSGSVRRSASKCSRFGETVMKLRLAASVGTVTVALTIGGLATTVISQSPAGWTAPRTPWGEPDIQGLFTTDDELGVPFERPATMGTRQTVTDAEFSDREAQAARQAATDAEEFVAPPATSAGRGNAGGRGGNPEGGGGIGPPNHWIERGKPSRRTSIVIDPPDGRIPFLNAEAQKRSTVAVNARTSGQ